MSFIGDRIYVVGLNIINKQLTLSYNKKTSACIVISDLWIRPLDY